MTQQKARVTRLLDAGKAEVSVRRRSACSHNCASCGGGCGELMVQSDVTVVAENPICAMVGDRVTIETSTGGVIQAAVLVYLVPFLLFFTGYLLAGTFFNQGTAIVLGGVGFVLGFVLAWFFDKQMHRQQGFAFQIVSIEREAGCLDM